jgi:hypothetical protein
MIEAYSQSGLSSIASFATFGTDQFAGQKKYAPVWGVLYNIELRTAVEKAPDARRTGG